MNRPHALLTAERCRPAWFRLALIHLAIIPVLAAASWMQVAPSTSVFVASAQVALLGLWLAMGTGRFTKRLLIVLLLGILLTALPLFSMRPVRSDFAAVFLHLAGAAFQIGLIAIPFGFPLGFLYDAGWRLRDKPEGVIPVSDPPLQYRVSHLLAWTTLVAMILALRNFVQSQGTITATGSIGFSSSSSSDPFSGVFAGFAIAAVTLSLFSAAIITAFWACLGLPPPGYRLAISTILVALLCSLPLHIAGGSDQVGWALLCLKFMAVVISSLLFLRYQGVRLVNIWR